MKKRDALLEMKQKEYMKLVIDVPVKDIPLFFQSSQEIGLTGEGYFYFFLSLDFHGQTNPMYTKKNTRLQTHRLSDDEIQELIFKDVGGDLENNNSSMPRYCFSLQIQFVNRFLYVEGDTRSKGFDTHFSYRRRNYTAPESALPHYRSFAYYRLMRQDHAEVTDLLERIYASTTGSPPFDEHKPIYKDSFEELRGTLNKGFCFITRKVTCNYIQYTVPYKKKSAFLYFPR